MVIMALDHTRDLLHTDALTQSPTDLNTTTPVLFFTRWITHLCAPTFVFLSGVSVYLSLKRNGPAFNMAAFLRKRGLWLIVLEATLITFAIWFDFQFRIVMLQVIAAIGVGFIILSFLLKLPAKMLFYSSLSIIVLHNFLAFPVAPGNPVLYALRTLWLSPGIIPVSDHFMLFVSYPLLQWTAIMVFGFSCGKVFEKEKPALNKWLAFAGLISIGLFLLLRILNIYGDPLPWASQKNTVYSVLSFLNVTKYPPSLQYTALFIGIAFIILRWADHLPKKIKNILLIYGSVPMFYYLLHFYLIRLATFIMLFAQGFSWSDLSFAPFKFGRPEPPSGISLAGVYLAWLAIVVSLYFPCKWYAAYKKKHPEKTILKYL
jgi:uncharacterized membrane protein